MKAGALPKRAVNVLSNCISTARSQMQRRGLDVDIRRTRHGCLDIIKSVAQQVQGSSKVCAGYSLRTGPLVITITFL